MKLREVALKYRRPNLTTDPSGKPSRRRVVIRVLPSLFTLGNLLCGFAALHFAALGDRDAGGQMIPNLPMSRYAIAGYFIFAAMLFDVFDGFFARLARVTSDFGAELDSLSDMVSFGVAPAFLSLEVVQDLIHKVYTGPEGYYYHWLGPKADSLVGNPVWLIAALYACCAALRLARFNVLNKHDDESHQAFRGLPSPGAAGVVVASIIFFFAIRPESRHYLPLHVAPEVSNALQMALPYVIPLVLLIAGLLMVSRFPYAHLINRFLRGRRRFNYLVGLLLVVLVLIWLPQITALLAIYVYAMSAPLGWLYRKIVPGRAVVPTPPVEPPGEPRA